MSVQPTRTASVPSTGERAPPTQAGPTVVPMAPEHLPEVAKLEVELFGAADAWDTSSLGRFQRHPDIETHVALGSGGEVQGYALTKLEPGPQATMLGHVLNLGVAKAAQGQGLGGALMAAELGAVAARGAETVYLEVEADNAAAQRLYAKLGFEVVCTLPGYYEGMAQGSPDGLLMARDPQGRPAEELAEPLRAASRRAAVAFYD